MLTFPTFLRGPLQAGYSRSTAATYQTSQPAAGAYYTQIISEDVPSYFTVSFTFKREFAMAFQAWLRLNDGEIKNGAQFQIPLSIEDGLTTQTGSFTPSGYPQYAGERAGIVSYNAEIVVPRLYIPTAGSEDLVLAVAEMGGNSLLDIAINFRELSQWQSQL